MSRVIAFAYGVISYLIFLGICFYSIGFVGDFAVSKSIDSGAETSFAQALFINVMLLGLFAVPHSVMARPAFKQWWTRIIPRPIERSTYVLASSLLLALLVWQWRPIGNVVWSVKNSVGRFALYSLFVVGWMLAILPTFMIDHFDFFGLRQVYFYLRRQQYSEIGFKTPALYKYMRHPIMLGFILVFWATPVMTAGHLIFAVASVAYIFVGVRFEEHDLVSTYGETYRDYKRRVPKFLPSIRTSKAER